jgi:type II secretory pathway pseudopilin PulG
LRLVEGTATLDYRHYKCNAVAASIQNRKRRSASLSAFTLIEVLFAVFILLIMALMFGAVSITATRTSRFSNSYNQAMSLAQHKVDQFQDATFAKVTTPTLQAAFPAAELIDDPNVNYPAGKSPAATTANLAVGSTKYTGYFTNVDNLPSYFPVGKDATGKISDTAGAVGKVELEPYPRTMTGAKNIKIKVTITWRDAGYAQNSYSTESVLTSTPNL